MEVSSIKIKVFVANLKWRQDRFEHIKVQFEGRKEFDVEYVEAIEHEIGDIGLWETFKKCVSQAKEDGEEVFIFCEDDHEFTKNYSWKSLLDNIKYGYENAADLLIGGSTGGMNISIPIGKGLIWVDHFCSSQFLIVYEKFYNSILSFEEYDYKKKMDNTLSEMSVNKFILFPYISAQKEFGYSDATIYNHLNPYKNIERFKLTEEKLGIVNTIYKRYH